MLLNRNFPVRAFFRAMIFAPFVLGIAVIGVLFNYLLDTQFGLINYLLGLVGIPPDRLDPDSAVGLGRPGRDDGVVDAGFQHRHLPGRAAGHPGATSTRRPSSTAPARGEVPFDITMPGLRNVLVFIVTTTVLASANMFGQSYLVTNGGPGDSTRTAIMVMTQEGLRSFKMGTASAMSYMLAHLPGHRLHHQLLRC